MAKLTNSTKITFGKQKTGRAKKSYNKHSPRPKQYRGQGRWNRCMNNKAAKKLRRLAIAIAAANGKIEDSERIYKNLKTVHKENKKAPQN